jgi:DNA-binding GntR family transcriptional regulator
MNTDIHTCIRNRILFLEYPSGKILNEKVLADEFGVSRTPLREVLYRLEWEQLVRILPRTGTLVTEIEFPKLMNVFQVRLEIEAMAGRLAAEMMESDGLYRLEELVKRCDALIGNRDMKALARIDLEFREILYEAARNPVLQEISDQLYNLTFRIWYMIMGRGDWNEEVLALVNEMKNIHGALSRRNPMEAADARKNMLLQHISRIRRKFLEITA